jgi:16S rRNA (cytidine1402-2'-O)-methyltransferase
MPSTRVPRSSGQATLYVVATPIGNLEDITLRALRILKEVHLVAAEDTRRTGNLLRHYQIDTPILSVHEHNERGRVEKIVGRLTRGESVALVTDAGTPAISDPGAELVAAVRAAGFRVEPIPGPSAVAAAVSASGISNQGFTFLGFSPIRAKDRKRWLEEVVTLSQARPVVVFEAPHRLRKTLEELAIYVKRPIIAARELTKMHEEFVSGTPDQLLARFVEPHGEFTLIIGPAEPGENAAEPPSDEEVLAIFGQITDSGAAASKREAARIAGEKLGLTAKQVYEVVERNK